MRFDDRLSIHLFCVGSSVSFLGFSNGCFGNCRCGKTELVKRVLERDGFLYLFVSRKSELGLVEGFIEELNRIFPGAVSGEILMLEGFSRKVCGIFQGISCSRWNNAGVCRVVVD